MMMDFNELQKSNVLVYVNRTIRNKLVFNTYSKAFSNCKECIVVDG